MTDDEFPVPPGVLGHWSDVLEEMRATAEFYRAEGWTTHELHPGHVAVLPEESDRMGFDLLVPDNEFDDLLATSDMTIEEFTVFREVEQGTAYCLVVGETRSSDVAVLIPLYYEFLTSSHLIEQIEERGYVEIHVHPLSRSKGIVTYEFNDPDLFLPDE